VSADDDATSRPDPGRRWLERATEAVAAARLRSGSGRVAVMELLAREGRCLLSAAEVADGLRDAGAGSAATVYRALEQLHGLGLVRRLVGEDGVARYEIVDPEHPHQHVVDPATGELRPFADEAVDEAIRGALARRGLELESYDLIVRARTAAGLTAAARRPHPPTTRS